MDRGTLQSVKEIDPRPIFEAAGLKVKEEGRHLSVRNADGDELYRSTQKDAGHWIHCHHDQSGIGDNIDLYRELHGEDIPFTEAVFHIYGGPILSPAGNTPKGSARKGRGDLPRIPKATDEDKIQGRNYLASRGITDRTLNVAREQGFLTYMPGHVVFCGLDKNGIVRNATRRETNGDAKRDFKHSDKTFAPILRGNPRSVWLVEGGVDALAVRDLYEDAGEPAPTVIVTGGVNVRKWQDSEQVRDALRAAESVFVAREWEKDGKTQEKADKASLKQQETVKSMAPDTEVKEWWPEHGKDVAEVRVGFVEAQRLAEEKAKFQAMQERGQEQEETQQRQSRGPRMGR